MFVATVVLTIVLAAVFLGAGIPKILGTKTSLRMRDQLQINPQLYRLVGFLEIAAVAGLLIGLVVPVLGAGGCRGTRTLDDRCDRQSHLGRRRQGFAAGGSHLRGDRDRGRGANLVDLRPMTCSSRRPHDASPTAAICGSPSASGGSSGRTRPR